MDIVLGAVIFDHTILRVLDAANLVWSADSYDQLRHDIVRKSEYASQLVALEAADHAARESLVESRERDRERTYPDITLESIGRAEFRGVLTDDDERGRSVFLRRKLKVGQRRRPLGQRLYGVELVLSIDQSITKRLYIRRSRSESGTLDQLAELLA